MKKKAKYILIYTSRAVLNYMWYAKPYCEKFYSLFSNDENSLLILPPTNHPHLPVLLKP